MSVCVYFYDGMILYIVYPPKLPCAFRFGSEFGFPDRNRLANPKDVRVCVRVHVR